MMAERDFRDFLMSHGVGGRVSRTRLGITIACLRLLRARRAAGHPVAYTTDPAWLLDMAIDRRAGWPDDPTHHRGSCAPVNGRYPKKAEGDYYVEVERAARAVNTPRLVVRAQSLGLARKLIESRLPERLHVDD